MLRLALPVVHVPLPLKSLSWLLTRSFSTTNHKNQPSKRQKEDDDDFLNELHSNLTTATKLSSKLVRRFPFFRPTISGIRTPYDDAHFECLKTWTDTLQHLVGRYWMVPVGGFLSSAVATSFCKNLLAESHSINYFPEETLEGAVYVMENHIANTFKSCLKAETIKNYAEDVDDEALNSFTPLLIKTIRQTYQSLDLTLVDLRIDSVKNCKVNKVFLTWGPSGTSSVHFHTLQRRYSYTSTLRRLSERYYVFRQLYYAFILPKSAIDKDNEDLDALPDREALKSAQKFGHSIEFDVTCDMDFSVAWKPRDTDIDYNPDQYAYTAQKRPITFRFASSHCAPDETRGIQWRVSDIDGVLESKRVEMEDKDEFGYNSNDNDVDKKLDMKYVLWGRFPPLK